MERLTGKQAQSMMEAFASVYENKVEPTETEQVEEGLAGTVDKVTKTLQGGLEKMGVPINRTKRGTTTKADQKEKIGNNVKEDADLFDIIKGHLIDEGLTEEEALKKMLTLTDDERSEIIEGSCDSKNKKKMKKGGY